MIKISPLSRNLALAFGGSMLLSAVALAQDSQKLERIEVTGSNIKRTNTETAVPVQVITRDEILKSGAVSLSEVLQNVTASGLGNFSETNTNLSSGGGAAGVSLRGLGVSYTLVLINGRRVAPSGFGGATGVGSFTDTNGIPLSAIDRVEVLKGSASAVYGADAVGGVINIIMRKDFKGIEFSASGGTTQKSDNNEFRLGISGGFGDIAADKYNVTLSLDHLTRSNIKSVDRSFSRTADATTINPDLGIDTRSITGNPGSFRTGTVSATGLFTANAPWRAMPNCPTVDQSPVRPAAAEDQYCVFNFLTFWDLAPKITRTGFTAVGTLAVTPDINLFGRVLVNSNNTLFNVAPTPLGVGIIAANAPGNSLGQAYQYRYRVTANGPRVNDTTIDFSSFVVGAQGALGNFDWDTAFNSSKTEISNKGTGYASRSAIAALAASGDLRPYEFARNPALEAAAAPRIAARFERTGVAKSDSFDAKVSGELFQLPAGPLQFAAGLETRKESIVDQCLTPGCATGDIDGANVTGSSGSRKINAQFFELRGAPMKGLDLTAAVRRDAYSTISKASVVPQFSAEYRPVPQLLVRGILGEGFKAPTLFEAYQSRSESFNGGAAWADQRRCPVTGAREDCGGTQVRNFRGGRPDLNPETSKNKSFGLVIEPSKDFSVSLDVFSIELEETIGLPSISRLLAREALNRGNPLVTREAATTADIARGIPGAIQSVSLQYANLGKTKIRGGDIDLEYRMNTAGLGKFTARTVLSYTDKYWQAPEPGVALVNFAGTNDLPRFRANTSVKWTTGPWEAQWGWRHVGSHLQDAQATGNDEVAPENYHDITATYTGFKNLTITGGIRNVFNRLPSFANGDSQAYSYNYGDPRGRSFWISGRYTLR